MSLAGRRIVITRAGEQGQAMGALVREMGGEPIMAPAIEIQPPAGLAELDAALEAAGQYDWVVFTSANGVRASLERAAELGISPNVWPVKFAAVGPATAAALESVGIRAELVPDAFNAAALAAALGETGGQRFLLLRADIALSELPSLLRAGGGAVTDVVAYRTVSTEPDAEVKAELAKGFDAVTFTSPSAVRGFLATADAAILAALANAVVASIGPVTSEAARAEGLELAVEAAEHTVNGLLAALARHFARAAA